MTVKSARLSDACWWGRASHAKMSMALADPYCARRSVGMAIELPRTRNSGDLSYLLRRTSSAAVNAALTATTGVRGARSPSRGCQIRSRKTRKLPTATVPSRHTTMWERSRTGSGRAPYKMRLRPPAAANAAADMAALDDPCGRPPAAARGHPEPTDTEELVDRRRPARSCAFALSCPLPSSSPTGVGATSMLLPGRPSVSRLLVHASVANASLLATGAGLSRRSMTGAAPEATLPALPKAELLAAAPRFHRDGPCQRSCRSR